MVAGRDIWEVAILYFELTFVPLQCFYYGNETDSDTRLRLSFARRAHCQVPVASGANAANCLSAMVVATAIRHPAAWKQLGVVPCGQSEEVEGGTSVQRFRNSKFLIPTHGGAHRHTWHEPGDTVLLGCGPNLGGGHRCHRRTPHTLSLNTPTGTSQK